MGITVKKTSEQLAIDVPAVHAWFPMKEERTGNTTEKVVVDYAQGIDLVGTANHDVALDDALRIVGAAGASSIITDAANVGSGLVLAADEHLIFITTLLNGNIADSIFQYGENILLTNTLYATLNGTARISAGGVDVDDTVALAAGTLGMFVAIDRATQEAKFNFVNGAGLWGTMRTVDISGSFGSDAIDFSNTVPQFNGLKIANGVSGASPLAVYNSIVSKFKGAFPTSAELEDQMIQWRADSMAGVKNIPPFMYDLVV